MALQILLSNWLACGYILSLLAGAGAMVFQHTPPAPGAESLSWMPVTERTEKWQGHWASYAELRGKLDDDRIRLNGPMVMNGFGRWKGVGGGGWTYL
jgi:hypothetical protein